MSRPSAARIPRPPIRLSSSLPLRPAVARRVRRWRLDEVDAIAALGARQSFCRKSHAQIDIAAAPKLKGTGYPPPFDAPSAERVRQRLGNAGGLTDFGVNLMRLPLGNCRASVTGTRTRRVRLCARRRTDADRRRRLEHVAGRRLRRLSQGLGQRPSHDQPIGGGGGLSRGRLALPADSPPAPTST